MKKVEESEADLLKEAEMIKKFHSDKVPILIKKASRSKLKDVTNNKILILKSFNVYKLIMVIKKKIDLNKTEALYLFVDNNLLQAGQTMEEIYDKYAGKDGFLHIEYYEYSTFGGSVCDSV